MILSTAFFKHCYFIFTYIVAGFITRVVFAIISSRVSVHCAVVNGVFLVGGRIFTTCFVFFQQDYILLIYSIFLGIFSGKFWVRNCLCDCLKHEQVGDACSLDIFAGFLLATRSVSDKVYLISPEIDTDKELKLFVGFTMIFILYLIMSVSKCNI